MIKPEKAKFYVFWANRFLQYYRRRTSMPIDQVISSYPDAMETDSCFAPWQVKVVSKSCSDVTISFQGGNGGIFGKMVGYLELDQKGISYLFFPLSVFEAEGWISPIHRLKNIDEKGGGKVHHVPGDGAPSH